MLQTALDANVRPSATKRAADRYRGAPATTAATVPSSAHGVNVAAMADNLGGRPSPAAVERSGERSRIFSSPDQVSTAVPATTTMVDAMASTDIG
jgi:hypothetical protein